MTDRSVNSLDSLYAAQKASQPGDSITIAAGAYGVYVGPPLSVAEPGVQIRPAAGAKVSFEGFDVSGSAGWKTSGLEIAVKAWGWKPALYSANAQRNTFDRMVIHTAGDPADLSNLGSGFSFRNSQDCALTNSEIHHVGLGGGLLQCDRILIDSNRFHHIAVDGIDIGTSNFCKIYRNDFRLFQPPTGAHPDAIQFWDTLNLGAKGNEARDNTINGVGSTPVPPQGIFVESQQDIVITGNAMTGTMSNGISLSTTDGALVQGNFVENAGVVFRGGSSGGVFKDNFCRINSPGLYVPAGDPPIAPADFVVTGTITIPDVAVGDTAAFDAWVAKAKAAGGTIPDSPAPPPPVVTPEPPPPPPPVVTPAGPTQADMDAANATIAALQARAASLQNEASTAEAQLAASTAQATKYATGLNAVIKLGTAANAKRQGPTKADMRAVLSAAQTALA